MTNSQPVSRPVRAVRIGSADPTIEHRANGCTYVRASSGLGAYPDTLSARLDHWAREAPDRAFLVERGAEGSWVPATVADMHARVRAVGQALLDRGLSPGRPLVILSGNSVDHATLALAAMHIGVPCAPISPAYSLLSQDHHALRSIFDRLEPGLVFVDDAGPFESALRAVSRPDIELVSSSPGSRQATPFADLVATRATAGVDAANANVGPDTIAKVLFTSGSTGRPKGVINTQRMLAANQAMIQARLAFLADAPPVLCDWLPWNHTFGGNHNFGLTLFHGGTMYLDRGRPTPEGFGETIRALQDVAPTVYFNVPRGYEMLVSHLRDDVRLCERFFSRLQLFFCAAAGLPQHVWDALQELAIRTSGEEILMITGFGATETAPAAIYTGREGAASDWIGVPLPGVELKLVPVGEKLEARLRGPSVTPGYWRDDELNAAAFDDEGFYRMGDAVRWVDPHAPTRGLIFDGRLNEDFKLSSGTWVSVGPLRARLLLHLGGLLQDVVIVGPSRGSLGALLFPAAGVADDAATRTRLRTLLQDFAVQYPASSTHVARALLLTEPPSFAAGEMTDKGSLNQKAVMARRAREVDELYDSPCSDRVMLIQPARHG